MKNLLLILFGLLISFSACKDDDSIERNDLCVDIVCENGDCVDGTCVCEDGYDGPNCNNPITPSSIKVTLIHLINWPTRKASNDDWDVDGWADLFVNVTLDDNSIYLSQTIMDAHTEQSHIFTPENLQLSSVNGSYQISLWDEDEVDHDSLGDTISFTPYDQQNGFPPSLSWSSQFGDIAFTLHFEYTWE